MEIEHINSNSDLNLSNAKLAYTIINGLLESNEALSDLLTVMAHALDEDVTRALTETKQWETYMESRRNLENTRLQIEKFIEQLKTMEGENSNG